MPEYFYFEESAKNYFLMYGSASTGDKSELSATGVHEAINQLLSIMNFPDFLGVMRWGFVPIMPRAALSASAGKYR